LENLFYQLEKPVSPVVCLIAVRNQFRPGAGGLLGVEGPVSAVVGTLRAPLAVRVVRVVHALVVPMAVSRVWFEEPVNIYGGIAGTTRADPAVGHCGSGWNGCGSRWHSG